MRPKACRVRTRPVPPQAARSGIVLPFALLVAVLLLILGFTYLSASATQSLAAIRDVQRLQATAAAEYGIARARAMADSQKGVWVAMTYNGSPLSWAVSPSYGGYEICNLFTNQNLPGSPIATYSVVIQDLTGDLVTSGTYRIHGYGTVGSYTRHVSIDSQALTFASFGWLTNSENDVYFRTGDLLSGLIWTNGQFNIDGDPVFDGPAYSGASSINYLNGGPPTDNPTFADGITFNVPTLNISSVLNAGDITTIKNAATSGGISEPSNGGNGYTLTFNSTGTFTLVKNGTSPTTLYSNQALSSYNGAFYFQDTLQVSGTIDGQVTIGTSSGNNIDITNNLVYSYPSNPATIFQTGFNNSDPQFTSKCALVSGGNVVLDENWSGSWTDMYVTAVCAAVTGSFENQYYTDSPLKTLHVYGGISQLTRGPVGTITGPTTGTGFLKDYIYDTRFLTSPPPYLPVLGAQFGNWQLY
jgi:hypothetical protein